MFSSSLFRYIGFLHAFSWLTEKLGANCESSVFTSKTFSYHLQILPYKGVQVSESKQNWSPPVREPVACCLWVLFLDGLCRLICFSGNLHPAVLSRQAWAGLAPGRRLCLPPLSMAFSRGCVVVLNGELLATALWLCGNSPLVVGVLLTKEDSFHVEKTNFSLLPTPSRGQAYSLVRWCSGFKQHQKPLQEALGDFSTKKCNCNS